MKVVYRVLKWTLEPWPGGKLLKVRSTTLGSLGTLCSILEASFPALTARVRIRPSGGLLGLSSPSEVELMGSVEVDQVNRLMNLLSEVLTVCDAADASHCLAVYRVPSDELPPEEWPYTEVGSLMYSAKYGRDMSAARDVAKELTLLVASHPALVAADSIGAVPSSGSGNRLDCPVIWRNLLARRFGFAEIRIWRTRQVRPQKDIDDREERLKNQDTSMDCEDVTGRRIIILDDLYMDGGTMDEATRAAKARGAAKVYGLCAVKTARGTRGGVIGLVPEASK